MKERCKIPKAILAALSMGILILDNQFAIHAVADGLQLCLQTVIPALFPFFVFSAILVSSLPTLPKPLLRFFKVSPAGGSILLTGLLGGYPVGAKSISEAYEQGYISKAEAERLLPICNQCGPAFLFGLTVQLFQDVRSCFVLWIIQIISVLLLTHLIPFDLATQERLPAVKPVGWSEALHRSIRSLATVCGWIILFRLLIQFLNRWFLWMLPLPYQILLSGILELTNGVTDLHRIGDESIRFLFCVGTMSFGGVCVTMQSISVIHAALNRSQYFPGKVLQAGIAIILTGIFQRQFHAVTALSIVLTICCVIFFRKSKKAVAIHDKLLYNESIKNTRELLCSLEKR